MGPFAQASGDGGGPVELGHAVERYPYRRPDRALEHRLILHRAVERDPARVRSRPQGRLQLAAAEDVAAGALVAEDPAQREHGVGLDGREQREGAGPARCESVLEAANVAAQLILGDHVERSPEAPRELVGPTALDVQGALSHGEALVEPVDGDAHASRASCSPVSGANWKPWPLHADPTTTRPLRSRMNCSFGVPV